MNNKIEINETGANSPKDVENSNRFNKIIETFKSLEDAKKYLVEKYGKICNKRKIYRDGKDGNAMEVGFLRSFWNKDYSHNSKAWYQTDWVEITQVEETPIVLAA